jgi:ATP/maltotriose-dependent transcriptional regulator MalT/two-component SAPR family response regulator
MKRPPASKKTTPKQKRSATAVPAKITPPRLGEYYQRKGLFQKLDQYRDTPSVWISGPAGSGKTMLAASYLKERRIDCLWYQVDTRDADPATLFYYIGLAAKHHSPSSHKSLPLLTPEYLGGLSAFVRNFFEALFERLKPPFALVLDNYQEVVEDAVLHEVMHDLLAVVPNGGQVILISRSLPPQTLGRFQVHQQMVLLDWQALQLSVDEVQALSGIVQKTPLTQAEATTVHAATMGWAAGVVLMLAQPQADAKSIDKDALEAPEVVFDYFAAEIVAKLDDARRDFLIKTAFLPQVSASMASALTGQTQAGCILADLARKNYFTLQRKSLPQKLYQYHPLFRDFLLQQAEQRLTPEQINTIRVTAADLLWDAQRYEEAVEYMRMTQSWNRLAAIILQMAPTLMVQGRNLTLLKWIGYIPERILDRELWLLFWRGVGKVNYSPEEGRKILEQVFGQFEKKQDLTGMLKCWAFLVNSIIYEWDVYDRLDKWIDILTEISNQGIQFENLTLEADVAGSMLTACYCRQPDHPDKSLWEERVKKLFFRVVDKDKKIQLGTELLFNAVFMGEFNDARSLIKEWSGFVSQNESIAPLTRIMWFYVVSLYEWLAGELDACAKTVAKVLQFTNASGVHVLDNYIIANGIYAGLGLGDPEMVQHYIGKAQTQKSQMGANEKLVAFNIESYWAMTLGETIMALDAAEKASQMAKKSGFFFTEAMVNIGYGQLLNETDNCDKGGKILEEVLAASENKGSKYAVFGALVYLADHAFTIQNDARGFDLLRRALLLGKKEGYYNLNWFHPEVVGGLFIRALKASIEVDYVRKFIKKRKLVLNTPPLEVENWPWAVKIVTLDNFSIFKYEKAVRFGRKAPQKPLEMLKLIIAMGGERISEVKIADALWPDADGDNAYQSMKKTLYRLRKLLGNTESITKKRGCLTLDRRYVWTDLWAFEALYEKIMALRINLAKDTGPPSWVADCQKAMALYQGDFLSDECWAAELIPKREQTLRRFLHIAQALGRCLEASAQWEPAIVMYENMLNREGANERFDERLNYCYNQLGRMDQAQDIYLSYKTAQPKVAGA